MSAAGERTHSPGEFGRTETEFSSLLAAGQYGDAERVAREMLVAAVEFHGEGSLEVARACDRVVTAMWRDGRAADPDALQLAERSLAIKEALLGPTNPEIADSLVEMARVLEYVGRIEDAHSSLRRAVENHEAANTAETDHGIRSATELGRMLRVMGRYPESRIQLELAMEHAEARFGRTHPITVAAIHEKGLLCLDSARYREGRQLLEEVLAIRESTLPGAHPDLAATLHDLGWACRMLDDLDLAQAHLERAFEIRDETLRPDHPKIAQTLENLGLLYWYAGRGPPMEPFERAHPIIERAVADGYWEAGAWLVHEGVVIWNDRQDYLTATRYYETAVDLFDRTIGPDHPRVYWALGFLCGAYWDTGRYDDSNRCSVRRREVLEALLERGDSPKLKADALDIEAGRLEAEGRFSEARELLRDALTIREDIYGPHNNVVGWTRFHTARLLQILGEYDESRGMYEQARQSWEGAGLWQKQPYEPILMGLSWIHEDLGEYEEAGRLRRAAIECQPTLYDDVPHPGVGPRLVDYARFLMRAGNPEEALDAALKAENVIRPHLRLTIPGLSEREGLRYAATWANGLDVVLSIAAQEPDNAVIESAFYALVRARALVLDEICTRQQLAWGARDPVVVELAQQLAATRGRLADLMVRGANLEGDEQHRLTVERARRDKEDLERDLSMRSAAFQRVQQSDEVTPSGISRGRRWQTGKRCLGRLRSTSRLW